MLGEIKLSCWVFMMTIFTINIFVLMILWPDKKKTIYKLSSLSSILLEKAFLNSQKIIYSKEIKLRNSASYYRIYHSIIDLFHHVYIRAQFLRTMYYFLMIHFLNCISNWYIDIPIPKLKIDIDTCIGTLKNISKIV